MMTAMTRGPSLTLPLVVKGLSDVVAKRHIKGHEAIHRLSV
jgi:hypothetical protein